MGRRLGIFQKILFLFMELGAMGKGYYFTLSIEIPEDMPKDKATEFYKNYTAQVGEEYNCDVEYIGITKDYRAEYKVFMNEGRIEKVSDGKG